MRPDRRGFNRLLLGWYRKNGRDLPWRTKRDPYRILLSEFMLQQTQVSRVLKVFPEFLARFPDVRSLARAPRRNVIVAWRGMGYNNRAVRLHELARIVVARHGGRLPSDEGALLGLPGIGQYTASAIRVSAFGKPVAAVDVNVRRVLSRYFWRMRSTSDMEEVGSVQARANALLPRTGAYDWNQAVMDLGSTVCTARLPACGNCPLHIGCASAPIIRPAPARKTRQEPSLGGIPNRIYRGRIVDFLRRRRSAVSLDTVGRAIHPSFSSRQEQWLHGLIGSLERDGLVRTRGNGTLRTRKVSLA